MNLYNLKIETQLRVGFFIIMFLLIGLGLVSWYQSYQLKQQTQNLYEHPLMVRGALGDFRTDVLTMQLLMKEVDMKMKKAKDPKTHQKLEDLKTHAFKQLEIVYDRYLGPRTDVDHVYNGFVEWNSLNDETQRLLNNEGDSIGMKQVASLFSDVQVIDRFAQAKSTQLYAGSVHVYKKLNIQLLFWVTGFILIILMLFYGVMRSIRNPLTELNNDILLFRDGKLDVRSKYNSKNEFGILSASFNALADTVQNVRELNEKAIRLDQLMLSEEDAHRFCHSLLSALLEDTWSQMGSVYLLNEDETRFEYFESIGMYGIAGRSFSATRYDGEFGQAVSTKKMQHITNIPEDSKFTYATVTGNFVPRELITIPVIAGNKVVAVITLAKLKSFSDSSLKLLHMIQGTLNARMGGILANRKIIAFSQKLEFQNIELESQKNELSAQTSELIEQNIELEMQKKQLDESNKLKTTFLSNMSHELRTPLNSVIALSGVLNRRLFGKVPEEEYSYLEVIERNGKNLLLLINDILDLSRIEAGREEMEIVKFNVNDLIADVVEMIEPQANLKNISLRYVFNNEIPPVKSDYDKMRHVLQNIVSNAVKFTEEGFVEISTRLDKDRFSITVSDTGIGIENKHLTSIFEEFRQADGSNSRRYGGTGLGLAIAKKYAEMLGGNIFVVSAVGAGSQFRITLPIHFEGQQSIDLINNDDFQPKLINLDTNISLINKKDKTILIVEDTEAVIIQMKDMLENQGYNLLVAHNGQEALEQIELKVPDGMILDLMMPGVDGFEVLKCIREEQKTEYLPVIILTAKYITKDELSFLKNNGIHQLIHKGDINKDQLLNAVASMVCNEDLKIIKPEKCQKQISGSGNPIVLVVEDNPDNMLTIRALLSEKFEIVEAVDGKMGIEMAYHYQPDLILMDIALPGINGIEAMMALRKDVTLKHIPVIAVSASAMKGDRESLMSYGFDGYISKPIDDVLFSKTIDEWIG